MKAIIEIEMDNAAFGGSNDERGQEVVRILSKLTGTIQEDGCYSRQRVMLRDVNGNTVGEFKVTR